MLRVGNQLLFLPEQLRANVKEGLLAYSGNHKSYLLAYPGLVIWKDNGKLGPLAIPLDNVIVFANCFLIVWGDLVFDLVTQKEFHFPAGWTAAREWRVHLNRLYVLGSEGYYQWQDKAWTWMGKTIRLSNKGAEADEHWMHCTGEYHYYLDLGDCTISGSSAQVDIIRKGEISKATANLGTCVFQQDGVFMASGNKCFKVTQRDVEDVDYTRWQTLQVPILMFFEKSTVCLICLEPLELKPTYLLCAHKFHFNCIREWLRYDQSCPLCRRRFAFVNHIL